MVKNLPNNVDELFFLNIVLLVLMVIYNGPKSNLYLNMMYIILFMYLAPITFNLFKWPTFTKNPMKDMIIGGVAGAAYLWFYNSILNPSVSLASVFATTAFEGSSTLENLMVAGVIPTVESVLFFVVIPGWILWKIGTSLSTQELNLKVILTFIGVAATFVLIHTTAFGLTNNTALIGVFIFSLLSLALVFFTKTVLPTLVFHIVINSYSIGLLTLLAGSITTLPVMLGLALALGFIFLKPGRA